LSYSEEFAMSNVMGGREGFGPLEIRSERHGDDHVVALVGELDVSDTERLADELMRAEGTDARRIVLDLSELQFIDTSGVRLVIEADARSRADGDRLRLVRGPRAVRRVFEIVGLNERLPFIDAEAG
jgi:anti-anti-sigma factor